MRKSLKEMCIDSCVKKRFAWKWTKCNCCSCSVRFEMYYKVNEPEHKLGKVTYCNECVKSREDAYDLTFAREVTAQDLAIKNELKYLRWAVEKANRKLLTVDRTFRSIISKALSDPGYTFGPEREFLMFTITKIENTINALGIA